MSDNAGGGASSIRSRFGADLPARAAAGVTMMAGALGLAWAGGFPFLVFWAVAGVIVIWEWTRMTGGDHLWARVGVGALTLILASPLALHAHAAFACAALVAGGLGSAMVAAPERRLAAFGGVLYAGSLVVGLNLLRASPEYGLASILWLFALVWGTDVFAYFGGRLIGGVKLWPSVSPGKTWSGAVVGALGGAALGVLLAWLAAPAPVPARAMFALGLAFSAVSQLGDLFESAMKRRAGVKDASHLIPGHGGVMDRLDGFIFAAALAAVVAGLHSKGTWIAQGLFQW